MKMFSINVLCLNDDDMMASENLDHYATYLEPVL